MGPRWRSSASWTASWWWGTRWPIRRPAPPTPGHNAQVAGMLGAAMGLLEAGAFEHLAGRVAFIGVPAEEYGDVEWRVAQRDAGRLEFMGGKPEMLRLGHLDDVDMGMMIHA